MQRSIARALSLFLIVFGGHSGFAQETQKLSNSQIMRLFGRALIPIDAFLNREEFSDQGQKSALQGVQLGLRTTEEVLARNCEDDLLPFKVRSYGGEERLAYRERYRAYMLEFRDALTLMQELLRELSDFPPELRDFGPLRRQREILKEIANESHLRL